MLNLSVPKAWVFLQLRIPLLTWYVVNVTAEVNDFRRISLCINRVSREEEYLSSLEVVNCRLK